MSSFSRGSFSGGFFGSHSHSGSGHRRRRYGHSRHPRRRGGCGLFAVTIMTAGLSLAGLGWWIA